ncbi:MAG TPA: hypothetical protein VNN73_07890 [Blastocatellia bacterium]|nr:hypothetical protein [Blastocatellia bacterium]
MRPKNLLFIFILVLLLAEVRAYAYTDPGSGALIWQMLLAASFGVMFYLRKIIGWVRRLTSSKVVPSSPEPLPADTEKEANL